MTIKFEKIKPGMTLYDVKRNTGFGSNKWSTWPVHVKEVDAENRRVFASWNHNKYEWMPENWVTKFRAKRPKK